MSDRPREQNNAHDHAKSTEKSAGRAKLSAPMQLNPKQTAQIATDSRAENLPRVVRSIWMDETPKVDNHSQEEEIAPKLRQSFGLSLISFAWTRGGATVSEYQIHFVHS